MYVYILIALLFNPTTNITGPVVFSGMYAEFQSDAQCETARREIDELSVPAGRQPTSFCLKIFKAMHL